MKVLLDYNPNTNELSTPDGELLMNVLSLEEYEYKILKPKNEFNIELPKAHLKHTIKLREVPEPNEFTIADQTDVNFCKNEIEMLKECFGKMDGDIKALSQMRVRTETVSQRNFQADQKRFSILEKTVESLMSRLDTVERRVDRFDSRLNTIEENVVCRLNELEGKLNKVLK